MAVTPAHDGEGVLHSEVGVLADAEDQEQAGGPGTLEMTRLIGGRWRSARRSRPYQRMKAAYGRGGVSSDQSASMSTPSRLNCSLAPLVTSCTVRSCSTGSATSTGTVVNMLE